MKKVRSDKVFVAIGVLLIIIGVVLIWFHIPYSPVKKEFSRDIDALKADNKLKQHGHLFEAADFSHLPLVIQRYIDSCGYIRTPQMSLDTYVVIAYDEYYGYINFEGLTEDEMHEVLDSVKISEK